MPWPGNCSTTNSARIVVALWRRFEPRTPCLPNGEAAFELPYRFYAYPTGRAVRGTIYPCTPKPCTAPARCASMPSIDGEQIVETKHVILATGSDPRVLPGFEIDGPVMDAERLRMSRMKGCGLMTRSW